MDNSVHQYVDIHNCSYFLRMCVIIAGAEWTKHGVTVSLLMCFMPREGGKE